MAVAPGTQLVSIPALAVSHLSHRYGSRVALDDVSLSVAPGTFVAMLGPGTVRK